MDLNILDKRLRAFEKKFRSLERYLRSEGSRPWRRAILILALIFALLGGSYYAYQFFRLSNARVARIDDSLARDFPSYESPYCRWLYGDRPDYDDCLRHEQTSFTRFEAAWHRGKAIPDVREQMIRCYASAQNEHGLSWRTAAECSEIDDDPRETGNSQ